MNNKKILIIGSSGFLGAHLVRALSSKNEVTQFDINPPEPVDPNTIPEGCKLWYDGCNTCSVIQGILSRCTRMMCFREDNPHCLDFDGNGH